MHAALFFLVPDSVEKWVELVPIRDNCFDDLLTPDPIMAAGAEFIPRARELELPTNSDQVLGKLVEQLTCPICLEAYREPKVLECHHVFCMVCLGKLADTLLKHGLESEDKPLFLNCPTCRQDSEIPHGGIKKFQSAFHIHSLFDIHDYLLTAQHTAQPNPSNSQQLVHNSPLPCSHRPLDHCSIHEDRVLEMYCETCEIPICCACIVHDHKSHSFSLMADVFSRQKEIVSLHSKLLEQQLQVVSSTLEKVGLEAERAKEERTSLNETLELSFQQLHKVLDARQTELTKELDLLTQKRLDHITVKAKTLQIVESESRDYFDTVRHVLTTGNEKDILALEKPLLTQLEQVSAEVSKVSSIPSLKSDLKFIIRERCIESLSTLGELYTQVPCAKNCIVRDLNTGPIEVGEKVSATLVLKDQHRVKMDSDSVSIESKVYPNRPEPVEGALLQTHNQCLSQVTRTSFGEYTIWSQPINRGRNKVEVTVNGEDVLGSPFEVVVRPHPTTYRHPVHCVKGMNSPWGVAVDSKGRIIATEKKTHRLVYLNSEDGQVLCTVGKNNLLYNQFQQPAAICVDKNDQLYITEMHTFNIKKCNSNGDIIKSVGSPGQGPLEFMSPVGISINPQNGRIYVADMENHRIQVLNSDLTFHHIFTGSRDGKQRLRLPSDIAFDRNGNMYVTDNEKHCVHVYTPDDDLVLTVGKRGKREGQLSLPFGVCVDDKDRLYVVEMLNNRVSIFTSSGQFMNSFGSRGNEIGQFDNPHRIAVDNAGYLYVTDNGNNRVQIF